MHVEVDVSNVTGDANFSGLDEPIIGQKKHHGYSRARWRGHSAGRPDEHHRHGHQRGHSRAGEHSRSSGNCCSAISTRERRKEELLIAVIPHIVRTEGLDDLDLRGIASGTEVQCQVRYSPSGVDLHRRIDSGRASPRRTTACHGVPARSPRRCHRAGDVPPREPANQGSTPHRRTGPRVTFNPAILETRVANPVIATLNIENAVDVFSVTARVKLGSQSPAIEFHHAGAVPLVRWPESERAEWIFETMPARPPSH